MSLAPETPSPSRRTRWKFWHSYLIGAFALGGVYGVASHFGFSYAALPASLMLPVAAAIIALAMVSTILWMRDIDELARQAHYEAWFWGGSTGICVLLFLVLAAPALPHFMPFETIEAALAPLAGSGGGFFLGVMTSLVVLTLAYGVWWFAFWLRKR